MLLHHPNFPWLEERTILFAPFGSYAYGTNTEESDRDYKGICIPPIDYYFGLQSFNQYDNSSGKNFKNTKDDIDITFYHINKFVKDAMKGVPNNIELLFLRKMNYIKLTSLGQELINHRHLFLSKLIYKKFSGYANSQKLKLIKTNDQKQGAHEYDTKLFMHTVRLLTSAIEILETGDFHTYRPNRVELMNCRNGRYSFNEALSMIAGYDEYLKTAYETSILPEKPDEEKINTLLIRLNLQGLELFSN